MYVGVCGVDSGPSSAQLTSTASSDSFPGPRHTQATGTGPPPLGPGHDPTSHIYTFTTHQHTQNKPISVMHPANLSLKTVKIQDF